MQNLKIKNQKLLTTVLLLFFIVFFFIPDMVHAALVPCGGTGQPACQFCHIFVLTNNVIHFVMYVLTPLVAVLMFIVGGMYFLVAAGNPNLFNKAKSILITATIGLVIIFVAWVFLNTFLSFIGVAQWTGLMDNPSTSEKEGWFKINCQ